MWNPNPWYWKTRADKLVAERDEAQRLARMRAQRMNACGAQLGLLSDYVAKLRVEPYDQPGQEWIVRKLRQESAKARGINVSE